MAVTNHSGHPAGPAQPDSGTSPRRDPIATYVRDVREAVGQIVGPSLEGHLYVVVHVEERDHRWRARFRPAHRLHLEAAGGVVGGRMVNLG